MEIKCDEDDYNLYNLIWKKYNYTKVQSLELNKKKYAFFKSENDLQSKLNIALADFRSFLVYVQINWGILKSFLKECIPRL